jgi:serine/threonine protein kinase
MRFIVSSLCLSAFLQEFAENGPVMSVDMDDGEVEFDDGSVNIVTEPLPVELARRYFRDVLSGLEYLHFNSVIHRDIKPENLLVDASGRVMIGDFGVSTLCEGDEQLITSTAGTGVFLAPEVIASGSRSRGFAGPQTDVWSLGVSLYFMLYGRLPWYAKSLPEIYRSICSDPLVFPTGLEFAHIPVAAQCLIRGMLEKDPRERVTIAKMLYECPWVTAEGSWALDTHCVMSGFPTATAYKSQPPVANTLCSREIQSAVCSGQIKPSIPATAAGAGECTLLAKMKSRLASWKREMCRRCDAKKAARAKKRATMGAKLPSSLEPNEITEAIKSSKAARRATAAANTYAITTSQTATH